MSTPINDGGAAFPIPHTIANANDPFFKVGNSGMSLRDYFAGQALASSFAEAVKLIPSRMTVEEYAESLYGVADAMLAARNNQPEKP